MAGRVHRDLGGLGRAGETLRRQRGHGLHERQPAGGGVVGRDRHGVGQLVDDVKVASVGRELRVPRPAAGGQLQPGLPDIPRERGGGAVMGIQIHPVPSEVGHEKQPTVRRPGDAVGMRFFLPAGKPVRGVRMLEKGDLFAERAVGLHTVGDHAAAAIVGRGHEPAVRREREVAGPRAHAGDGVERGERAAGGDGVGVEAARLALGHGIEKATVGGFREKGRA